MGYDATRTSSSCVRNCQGSLFNVAVVSWCRSWTMKENTGELSEICSPRSVAWWMVRYPVKLYWPSQKNTFGAKWNVADLRGVWMFWQDQGRLWKLGEAFYFTAPSPDRYRFSVTVRAKGRTALERVHCAAVRIRPLHAGFTVQSTIRSVHGIYSRLVPGLRSSAAGEIYL